MVIQDNQCNSQYDELIEIIRTGMAFCAIRDARQMATSNVDAAQSLEQAISAASIRDYQEFVGQYGVTLFTPLALPKIAQQYGATEEEVRQYLMRGQRLFCNSIYNSCPMEANIMSE